MRSRVEVVADVTDDGRPVVTRLHAEGALAVRRTGPGQVHLVGAAAGPLNGDRIEVRIQVRRGASLSVRGVAATLALPRQPVEGVPVAEADLRFELSVEDGARLDQQLPALVVCRGARVRVTTRLALFGSGQADLTDVVVLGRHGERGGDWSGRLIVDRHGRPVLRSTQRGDVLRLGDDAARVVVTRLVACGPGAQERPAVSARATRCPLASGDILVTAVGADVVTAVADAEHVTAQTGGGPQLDRAATLTPS